ncbi:MAG: N-acetylmuramoyl-L-alanine amidase family protein [Candidatus Latescibacterota bacterium]
MKKSAGAITAFGVPAASVIAFLILLFSSPLYSNTTSIAIPSVRFAHGDFVSIGDFAKAFGVSANSTPANHKLTLSISGHPVVFTRQSSVIRIDQEIHRMPHNLQAFNGQYYIPQQTAERIAQHLRVSLQFDTPKTPVVAIKKPSPSILVQAPKSNNTENKVSSNAVDWTLKTVVIDPGHGGKDPGAIGPNGTHEKTIVLGVAHHLKKMLEKHLNVHVIMTRDDDTFIPLSKRSRMAIQQNGKIFISLHCNATPNREANGVEVYFLSDAKTEDAIRVAQAENAALKYEVEDSTQFTLNHIPEEYRGLALKLFTAQFLKESQELAADVHNAIVGQVKATPRGVKQANFYVMRGTMGQMPSVLVELGFVTNHAEEKQLKNNAYQKKLAEALYQGIKTFKQRYEQQLSADSS